jgi:hypothetical protein
MKSMSMKAAGVFLFFSLINFEKKTTKMLSIQSVVLLSQQSTNTVAKI